jgi:hypothetical protein
VAKIWTSICVLLAGVGVALNLFAAQSGGEARAAGPEVPVGQVDVASVVGVVEVRQAGGEWEPLAPGRELVRGDEIRTGDFSQVMLRPEAGAVLTLTPNTTFTIGDETPETATFTLGVGRVAADIRRRRDRTYAFDAAGGDARADTQGGEFSLVADGEGLLGVVTRRGEVGLQAQGRRVVVPAGQQAVALPGLPPGDPLAIPDEVFLQVQWPDTRTRAASVRVAGRTDVGARVHLGGRPVAVDPEGRFETEVALTAGENQLVVLAEDAAGNLRRTESPVLVREVQRRPRLELKVEESVWE